MYRKSVRVTLRVRLSSDDGRWNKCIDPYNDLKLCLVQQNLN